MASISRSSLLRQPALAAAFRQDASIIPASRSLCRALMPTGASSNHMVMNRHRRAAFQTSSQRSILPPLPQTIQGTANDAAPVPEPSPTHGSYHWTFERLIAASLVPLTIAPFAAGSSNAVIDALLCGAIVIHSHIGFQSCIIDYIPHKRLPKTRKFFWWGLRAATATVAIGLYEFETNDVGLTEAIKRIWTA